MRRIQKSRLGAVVGVIVLAALAITGCQIVADLRDVSLYPDGGGSSSSGTAMTCTSVADCPPGDLCTVAQCDGVCSTQQAPDGTSCENGGGNCVAGKCVCAASTCPGGCFDLMTDAANCGACGNGCPVGIACVGGTCCTPQTCAALGLTCGTASDGCGGMVDCNDGMKDGTETDVDCGGIGDPDAGVPPCPPCPQKDMCVVGSDCTTGLCQQDICCGTTCTGVCMQCNLSGFTGTCTPTPKGEDGTDCSAVQESACDGTGQCKYLTGHRCGDNADCLSGECNGPPPPQFSYCM